MPLDNPRGGAGYAAEFQSSALPWMTSSLAPAAGSPNLYKFNYVSRFVSLINQSTGSISMAATYNGITKSSNKVVVPAGQSLTLEWRLTQLFVQSEGGASAPFTLAAGLTTIRSQDFPLITGSYSDGTNWAGVG